MDTSELLRRAWEAVEQSGVPDSLHEAAFRAAVEDLRTNNGGSSSTGKRQQGRRAKAGTRQNDAAEQAMVSVEEDTFFADLAHESGVPEADLRDVLSLSGGNVHVTPPTRKLGASKSEQAKTVIALVAGGRAFGLGERPINATAVRDEVKRKNCYDQANYATKHLGALDGFNRGGSSAEIVTTSKWVGEFAAAVAQALGRNENQT